MLEYLSHFARQPGFLASLWVGYDCHIESEDLFERLVTFFSRVRVPPPNFPSCVSGQ
jgi:brefeldin A-resistance guanine nucleotide exchange factor 1